PLFGDAAGAVVIERDESAAPMRFSLGADGAGGEQVFITAGGNYKPSTPETLAEHQHCITMHGREVYRSAVRTMTALGAEIGGGAMIRWNLPSPASVNGAAKEALLGVGLP